MHVYITTQENMHRDSNKNSVQNMSLVTSTPRAQHTNDENVVIGAYARH